MRARARNKFLAELYKIASPLTTRESCPKIFEHSTSYTWIFDNLVEIHVYFLDSADERSNMGPPKILIFGERRKCRDLNSRASSLSQATYDEAVAIDFGELRANDSELKD